MLNLLLLSCALVCYFSSTLLIAGYIRANADTSGDKKHLRLASILGLIGVASHITYAYLACFVDSGFNFSTHSMLMLISSILVLIYLLGSLAMPIRRLGIMVFPLTILNILFALLWNKESTTTLNASPQLIAHILISILAYSLLTIATVQGLLYVYQERQIKKRTKPAMLMALPPLQTMEQLLFRLITIGFVFLTLTLFSGAIFSQSLFGHAFLFNHHTILAFLGWLVFATILFKRVNSGLRGTLAVILTVVGFLLIQLGYFGTKIISESIALN